MLNFIRAALVILAAVILQLALFNDLRIADVAPEFGLAVALAAGLTAGPDHGAVVGFAIGLTYDLFLVSPFGLSALTYGLIAYAMGLVGANMTETTWLASAPIIAVGTLTALWLFVLLGEIVGQSYYDSHVWKPILIATGMALVLGGPAARLMRWAWGSGDKPAMSNRPIGLVN